LYSYKSEKANSTEKYFHLFPLKEKCKKIWIEKPNLLNEAKYLLNTPSK
jgi:hypothetical protein